MPWVRMPRREYERLRDIEAKDALLFGLGMPAVRFLLPGIPFVAAGAILSNWIKPLSHFIAHNLWWYMILCALLGWILLGGGLAYVLVLFARLRKQ